MNISSRRLPVFLALILAGCATAQMNWDSKVGQMTYDQAVSELGRPAGEKKLADGRTVAEWISRFPSAATGMDNDFRYHSASFGSEAAGAGSYESKLSFTFDTNNILTGWSKD